LGVPTAGSAGAWVYVNSACWIGKPFRDHFGDCSGGKAPKQELS
jgi:hypothetical protein